MKNCSNKQFKKKYTLHSNYAKRLLKRPEGSAYEIYLCKKFERAANETFNLNYTGTPKLRIKWLS